MEGNLTVTETISVHHNSPTQIRKDDYLYDFSNPFEAFDEAVQQLNTELIHIVAGVHPGQFSPTQEWRRRDENIHAHFKRVSDHIVYATVSACKEPLSRKAR